VAIFEALGRLWGGKEARRGGKSTEKFFWGGIKMGHGKSGGSNWSEIGYQREDRQERVKKNKRVRG